MMTTEQRTTVAQLAAQIDAAYQQVHAAMLRLYDGDMLGATDMDTRVLVSEAEMRLDSAAERLARIAKGATNG